MNTYGNETEAAKASVKGSDNSTSKREERVRLLGSGEMIDRLAKAMRLKSGLDLPHGYFVEQVKLQLTGSPAFDRSLVEPRGSASRRAGDCRSAACFESWALRE